MSSANTRLINRDNYTWFQALSIRWMDNDINGHVNNVHYYSYFDTVANSFLINRCGLDVRRGDAIGLTVHSECFYRRSLSFPDDIEGGFRVNRIGNSSVEYGIGIFRVGDPEASAHGTMTHVFVDRISERPIPIQDSVRTILAAAMVSF